MKNPPGGRIMMIHGSNDGPNRLMPRRLPLPRISRGAPISSRATMKPALVPTASSTARPTGCLDANASCRPRMMQLTTMRATKAPSCRWMSGTIASSIMSATVTNVAMMST